MNDHNMIYNSQKEHLIISEYGRNVHNLIKHAKGIEDDEERQAFADSIIDLMHQMNPSQRANQDYKDKLWRHFFRIAEFDIKVKTPSGEVPSAEDAFHKPKPLGYPANQKKFRQYGQLVKDLIQKAAEMEDEEKKIEFVMIIASYMKLAYKTWNQLHYVSDEMIKEDIQNLSDGKITIPEDRTIEVHSPGVSGGRKGRRSSNQSHGRSGSRQNRGSNRRRR
jgi:hypothetical protein